MSNPPDSLEHRRKRALYRANYRGTREMDWLLGNYAKQKLAGMADRDLALFEDLLGYPDPELHVWISTPVMEQRQSLSGLVADIRRFHGLDEG